MRNQPLRIQTKIRVPLVMFIAVAAAGIFSILKSTPPAELTDWTLRKNQVTREYVSDHLKKILVKDAPMDSLPSEIDFPIRGQPTRCTLQYSFDAHLQVQMEALFETYRPDYGAFVAMDAATGRILALVSYNGSGKNMGNLVLKGNLPSASVFKVVTAAAGIEKANLSGDSIIPFNGRNHTLYRKNVFDSRITRWTRHITLREAFGKSINTVFGRVGALMVGPSEMREYASLFGFNRPIHFDLPVEAGRAEISEDSWKLAETSSGYTQQNTMSPLQGALIASTIANDGVMMSPYLVESVSEETGGLIYTAHPQVSNVAIDPKTAAEIRSLMEETVHRGTARSAFRSFFKQVPYSSSLEVGGKTGSLTGSDPEGKYDWFVGYARNGEQKLAFAALTVHRKFWKVKSAYLARKAIEAYFSSNVAYTGRKSASHN